MPSLRTSQAENPLTGAGLVRYFKEEKGIKVEPTVFIGITVAFIVLEIVLNVL
jgi:preprotein translocase subunit Sec61beta